jgi:hypothetical protein
MFGAQGQNTGSQKLAELMVLKSLSDLYADVHNAQTQELSKRKDDGGAQTAPTLDDVWAAFEKRCAMLDVLLHRLSDSSLSDGGAARSPTPVPPPQQPTVLAATDPQIPPAPPVQPPAPPPSSSESGTEEGGAPTNPMAFFKKKQ